MADSVNRIVPPSLSVDRTTQLGKEREKKKRGDTRRQEPSEQTKPLPLGENQTQSGEVAEAEENKTKGKNLDVNA